MVKDARITDPYVKRRLDAVRRQSGESTITKTAARLVLERIAQLEVQGEVQPERLEPDHSVAAPSAA